MKYIILGDDHKEYGPIDAETLRKWVENGRVMPGTKVRNALLKNKWGEAEKLDFLQDAFAVLADRRHEEAGAADRFRDLLFSLTGGRKKPEQKKMSAYRHAYLPQPASVPLRGCAWLFDLAVLALAGGIFLLIFRLSVAGSSGAAATGTCHLLAAVYAAGVLLYYGLTLGIFAQTFGMWFWGIMLARPGDDEHRLEEVYFLRAYGFVLAMFLLGALMPLALLLPGHRAPHDLVSGCVVVGIAARPKA